MSPLASGELRQLLDLEIRRDFATFVHRVFQTVAPGQRFLDNWHIEAIAHHLQLCLTSQIRRLIITLPPRQLKSICASVALPAFALGLDPTRRVICASYAQDLAAKHARDCRLVLESAWYQRLFPHTRIDPRKNSEGEFATTKGGFRLATSVGGPLTGRGADLIIVDDPLKPADAMSAARRQATNDWHDVTLLSRLDSKAAGVIILVMQRLHVDDLVGHVLQKGEWVQLNLPAIAEAGEVIPIGPHRVHHRAVGDLLHPEREPLLVLQQLKASMGSQAFQAQYQQAPVPAEGNLVRRSWLRHYAVPPRREPNDRVVQSWDTASKAEEMHDFAVCTTWLTRGKEYYLLDVFRERLEYPELRRAVLSLARQHRASSVLIEDKGSGTSLIQDLKRSGELHAIPCKTEADKVTRLYVQTDKFEAGQILVPAQAPWLDAFLAELLAFPGSGHDDQVDAVSQFLGWLDRRPGFRGMVKLHGVY